MVDLSTENKALCFEDSTKKPLKLFIYYPVEVESGVSTHEWHYFTTIENAIILESAEIEEGILDSNKFELGSFVIPQFKVKWNNDGIKYKNLACIPVQQIGDEYIAYFDGYIKTEEISSDNIVTATIVPFIDKVLDVDVSPILTNYGATTVAEAIYSALLYGDTITNPNIKVDVDKLKRNFVNANKPIPEITQSIVGDKLPVSDFLKMCGEFLGANIKISGKRKVDINNIKMYQFMGSYTQPETTIEFVKISNINTVLQGQMIDLPSEYKRVEYIESNGTQYIDTNILPDDKTKIQIKFSMNEYSGGVIVGYKNTETDAFRLFNYNGDTYLDYGSGQNYNRLVGDNTYEGRINIGGVYNLEIGNRYVKDLDTGLNKVYGSAVSFGEKTFSIGIFNGGNIKTEDISSSGKIFYCKIYKSDVIVANLVPCIRVSDNTVGMYDAIRNQFFANQGVSNFTAPSPIKTYNLPYYIDLIYDKRNNINFGGARVLTNIGDQRNYTYYWGDTNSIFEIKDNLFFNLLSSQSWQNCENAVREVATYIQNLNLYYCELRSIYAPFFEPSDYLICKSKQSKLIPQDYLALEHIGFKDNYYNYIKTPITYMNIDNFEFNVSFEKSNKDSVIFRWGGFFTGIGEITISLMSENNGLYFIFYNKYITISNTIPINQKINLNFKISKNQESGNWNYQYSGTFNGNGNVKPSYPEDVFDVLEIGSSGELGGYPNCKIYSFSYHQAEIENRINDTELYPCIRKYDGAVGMVDILTNKFYEANNQALCDYEFSDIAVPILSSSASGIHSMRADIRCKATETK